MTVVNPATASALAACLCCFLTLSPAHAQSSDAPSAEAAPSGALEVLSEPQGADVILDGAPAGKAPLQLNQVSEGTHEVVLRFPDGTQATRSVQVRAGAAVSVTVVSAPPSAAAPSSGAESPSSPRDAWRDVGVSVLELPWAPLAVGVSFTLLLISVVVLTTIPADVPVFSDAGINISTQQWRALGLASALGAAVSGVVASILLVVRLEPVTKMFTALRASTRDSGQKP